ncbi:uncharacterized protein F5147DRAFT_651121 [Suillus discolor]|uniref:Uncharacterized protein n=1 Tax=Suillus discolor TaxID=1912936 RepID=A0A9P7FBM7_9AGAM|nr:uncharacterized protein F5147DRAFT_651121 [Suillus discolor]KAG2112009.1 hypothetical protein F5147DRAFT_651121 [Suillus discolor]
MFHKRVKKLTEKAAQAVAEGTQKLKRKVSTGSQEPSLAKKSKHISLSSPSKSKESSSPPCTIEAELGKQHSHVFKCMGKGCKQHIQCYLDKGNAKSTSNMAKHTKSC